MKNDQLISVIIPVFGVEKYLDRCIASVCNQTYRNLEIILVDDGSKDSSGNICDKWAKEDSRILVFHKSNGGLSSARNYGVAYAKGDYISFIDADDYIKENYIEYLYGLISKYSCDISICCYVKTADENVQFGEDENLHEKVLMSGRRACFYLLTEGYRYLITAWGKLYKKHLVLTYLFPEGRIHEDEATTYKYYYNAKKVVVGNQQCYAYRYNPSSITHLLSSGKNHDAIKCLSERAIYFSNHGEYKLEQLSWEMLFNYLISESIEKKDLYYNDIKDIFMGKKMSGKYKMQRIAYLAFPNIYKKLKGK